MRNPFKKKTTAAELGRALLSWTFELGADTQASLDDLAVDTGIERETLEAMLVELQAFSIDFAVAMTLDSPIREAVLDAYYSNLREDLARPGDNFDQVLAQRFGVYTRALKTHHHVGPPWMVGKALASLAGIPDDIRLITLGSIHFTAIQKFLPDALKRLRIVR